MIFDNFLMKLDALQRTFYLDEARMDLLLRGIAAIVGSIFLWLLLKKIFGIIETRIGKYEFLKIDKNVFKLTRQTFLRSAAFLMGIYVTQLFSLYFIEKILCAIFVVAVATPVYKFFRILLGYLKKNIALKTDTRLDDTIFDLLDKFVGAIFFFATVVIAFDILGLNVMPFVAGAGIMGLAIGFAAKDTLSNLIAGVLLIIDRPFEVGDRIETWSSPPGSSSWGDVLHIGLRATKIKTTDNIIIVIPNNSIMRRDIVNYTILSRMIRIRIEVGISYDANIARAKEIILNIVQSVESVLDDPAPNVHTRSFGESSIDLRAIVWISDAREKNNTISFIIENIKLEFDKEGIEIPYPKRDVMIIEKGAPISPAPSLPSQGPSA